VCEMVEPNGLTSCCIAEDPRSLLEWISTYDYSTAHHRLSKQRQQNTGGWILETPEFRKWFDGRESSCLWCSGIRMQSIRPVSVKYTN
jgi:hypothetical protein